MTHEDDDELESFEGKYDWNEAFAQNPDQPVFDVPDHMRDRLHGQESAEDAQARAIAQAAEEYAKIADLDPDSDEDNQDRDEVDG